MSRDLFWSSIESEIEKKTTISGYVTVFNCESRDYPFEQCIRSMLQFCDEVCVIDGGSTDKTLDKLNDLKNEFNTPDFEKIKVKIIPRDWDHPKHAIFDGMQKAEARNMCTGDFCWQMDSDEIVHEDDVEKILSLCKRFPSGGTDILSLPVVEYWGGPEKIRIDIQPWKWRLSLNKPYITHGVPVELRAYDENGDLYIKHGSDGCDMIYKDSGERINHFTFHTPETEKLRIAALSGNAQALNEYSNWFNNVISNIPGVYHYSWYDMERKIKLYKVFWTKFWNSLYNRSMEDTAESNMMFDLPWSEVTDEMIKARAVEIAEGTGGWIWHRKWTGEKVPHITINKKEPLYAPKRL
jgi:glycosyltransferase involved in cell wall biosynthesis